MATLKVTDIRNESFTGTTQLKLDSSGRLLIGTTTEGHADADNITIEDTANAGLTIRSGTSNWGSIYFSDATSGAGEYDAWIQYTQQSRYLSFGTAQGTRLTILSDGKVGIGTTSPNSRLNLKLSSRGSADFRITDSDTTNDVLRAGSQADGDGFFQLRTIAGAGNVLFDASGVSYFTGGNVGIGKTSDIYEKLNILDASQAANSRSGGLLLQCSATSGADVGVPIAWRGQIGNGTEAQTYGFAAICGRKENSTYSYDATSSKGYLQFCTTDNSAAERMRITSSGNVGIGTTTPDRTLDVSGSGNVYGKFQSTDATGAGIEVSDTSETWLIQADGANSSLAFYDLDNTAYRFHMKSDGTLKIVGRGFETATFSDTGGSVGIKHNLWSNNELGIAMSHKVTGGQTAFSFYNPNGNVGYIQTSGSATIYSTSSDYRLKENEVAISDGITRLKQLKPYRFNFKKDPSTTVDGFFAHEVEPVVPQAVSGTKDQVATKDEGDRKTGDPMYQGLDYGKITPLLTAALQEAITKIETLETKVAALEAG